MRKIVISCIFFHCCIFIACSVSAKDTWTYYTEADNIKDIALYGDYIWCNTSGGIIRWDKRDTSYVKYTIADGLIENNAGQITVDSKGSLWIGWRYISVYRESGWEIIELNKNVLFSDLKFDNNGLLWNAHYGQQTTLSSFDGLNWKYFSIYDNEIKYMIDKIAVDSHNTKWFTHNRKFEGISSFDNVYWEHYSLPESGDTIIFGDIYVDEDDIKWMATSQGVSSYNGTSWHHWSKENGLTDGFTKCVTEDKNGIKWFGTKNGIVSFDGLQWTKHEIENNRTDVIIYVISIDNNNIKWCGTPEGLFSFDSISWNVCKEDGGPFNNSITNIVVDEENTKWFGFDYQLPVISSFNSESWKHYNSDDGLDVPDNPYVVMQGDDKVKWFIADNRRTYSYNGESWMYHGDFECIALDNDNTKWFGGKDGVYHYDGEDWNEYTYSDYTLKGTIYHCIVDKKNKKWFGLNSGVVSFDGIAWDYFNTDVGLAANKITSMAVDYNNVKWLGHAAGVSSYDDVSWTDHTKKEGPVSDIHTVKISCDNTKWFGTEDGLWSYDDTTWRHYSGNEIPQGSIHILAIGLNNTVWMCVNETLGVIHFDGREAKFFTKENGLISNIINTIAIDHDGVKWFGTDDGISSYKEDTSTSITTYDAHPDALPVTNSYPNPFNPSTTIEFTLPESGFTTLLIYNISGQKVRELAADHMTAGTHSLTWDGRDDGGNAVSSGVYITRLVAGKQVATGRMILLK